MYLDDLKKENCCGCMACAKSCPVSAIKMKQDETGFYYPQINEKSCIHCNLCRMVCPLNANYVGQDANPDIYAVRSRSEDVLKKSSSGGVFTLLADWVLMQGGVVYGVAFDSDFAVRHERATTRKQVDRFRTSKYVESDLSAVYGDVGTGIESDLAAQKTVLLTGTPCQIAGITSYLDKKHINTEKLYTCDNVCHGVPSRRVWEEYLALMKEKYIGEEDEIAFINMRSKSVSWKKQKFEIGLKKGNIDEEVNKLPFNKLFLSLMVNRPSCFECHFTSYLRLADFSLGDFWNAENAGVPFDIEHGISEVLVNTPKAQALFEIIREGADVQKISKQQAWQPYLEYSGKRPKNYDQFWEEYLPAADKEAVIRKYEKGSFVTQVIHAVSPVLRKTGLYNIAGKLYRVVFARK